MKRDKTHKAMMNTLAKRMAEQGCLAPAADVPERFRRALAILPLPDLLLLMLREGAGLKDRVIANMLGTQPEEVTESAERALDRLRQELRAPETDEFEQLVADTFGPMSPEAKAKWQKAKRKPGRPKVGQGTQVISLSLEKGLLARSDALAHRLGIARSALIAEGLRDMLAHAEKD